MVTAIVAMELRGLFHADASRSVTSAQQKPRVRSSCDRNVNEGSLFHGWLPVCLLSLDPSLNMVNTILQHAQNFSKFIQPNAIDWTMSSICQHIV